MRILVTGASGFAGRAVTAALAKADHPVRAAARFPAGIPSSPYVEPVYLPDLVSDIDWTSLLQDVDAVVHLAGIAHAGSDILEIQYDRVNHLATETLARACAARKIRLVFVSSIRAQTGPAADCVLTEADTPQPDDAYGRSKLAAENAVRHSGANFTILRPVVMYGHGVKGNVATLLRLADTPLPLPFAGFQNQRSLLALDNLVSSISFALSEPSTLGETYIVADETPVSLAGMIETLRRALQRDVRLFALPPAMLQTALKAIGKGGLWERIGGGLAASAAKLRAAGWRPVIDTPAGLAAMAQAASPRKSGTASRNTP